MTHRLIKLACLLAASCGTDAGSRLYKHDAPPFQIAVPAQYTAKPPAAVGGATKLVFEGRERNMIGGMIVIHYAPIGHPNGPRADHESWQSSPKVVQTKRTTLPGGVTSTWSRMTTESSVFESRYSLGAIEGFEVGCHLSWSTSDATSSAYRNACDTLAPLAK